VQTLVILIKNKTQNLQFTCCCHSWHTEWLAGIHAKY